MHTLNSVGFTPNHSPKLLISFLLGPLLEKCFNSIAIPAMRNQDASISIRGHGVQKNQGRYTAMQKSGSLYHIMAFLFLLRLPTQNTFK